MALALKDGGSIPNHAFIEACRNDPNPFLEYVLDIDQAPLHEEVQDFYTANCDCAVGLSRGHGKTTQTLGRITWEIGRALYKQSPDYDPDIRWKYVQANVDEAVKSVDTTRRILESARFKQVFPGLVPDSSVWGKRAFRFHTDSLQRDPTMEACTIFGHAGGRATDMVFDDICTLENSVRRTALRGQVKEAYYNTWLPMLTGDRRRTWHVFTPWHVDDITADWKNKYEKAKTLLWRPCKGTRSPWPEAFASDYLTKRQGQNPIAYARAYLLEPMSAEVLTFPAEWLEGSMYVVRPGRASVGYTAMTLDFAYTEKRQMGTGDSTDPDYSVALVADIDVFGHVWLKDMIRVRETFPEFKRLAIALGRIHGVKRAKGEAVAGQRGLVQQFNEEAPFPVESVNRTSDKVFRASSLQPFVSTGRFHIKRGPEGYAVPSMAALFDEMILFPSGAHDDCVDAAMDMMEMALEGSGNPRGERITDQTDIENLRGIYI